MSEWGQPASDIEAQRRAGGRRRYNARRTGLKEYRRMLLAQMFKDSTPSFSLKRFPKKIHRWGFQAQAAEILGVSPSTICRDLQAIWRDWRERADHRLTWLNGVFEGRAKAKEAKLRQGRATDRRAPQGKL